MNVVFMGTPAFAVESLKALIHSSHKVQAVVTVPDKPQGRGQAVRPSPMKVAAQESRIPVLQPVSLKEPRFVEKLSTFEADVFVVVAFRILPVEVFTIPPKGTVNIHASLLPRYRGAAPINWAIINGETETGVTSILIDEKVDTGHILLQKKTKILPDMNAGELHDILATLGADLLIQTLDRMERNSIQPKPQDNHTASKAPKITKELCHISFDQPSTKVHNLIRGLSPYPAAFSYLHGQQLKLLKSQIVPVNYPQPAGTICAMGKEYFDVACADGAIRLLEVQPQGKKRMKVRDFLNGYSIDIGNHLQ